MAWLTITEAHLLVAISGEELEALREAALADGQADPVQPAIDAITQKVRAYVGNCATNQLGAGNTIPHELLDSAIALIVVKIMTRPAGTMIDPKSARAEAARAAMEELRDAAKCGIAIEQPATVSDQVTSGGSSVVLTQRRNQVTGGSLGSL
jgi:hypothetical protein